jgi:hypothetical protein
MRRRIQPPKAPPASDYPTLSEHLLTRRNLLTWTGASAVSGVLWVSCISGDDDSGPGYYTTRIPETGDALATFATGGACRFYVTVTSYSENGFYVLIDGAAEALAVCQEVLARQDFAALTAGIQGGDPVPHQEAERQLAAALVERLQPLDNGLTAALTIVERIP